MSTIALGLTDLRGYGLTPEQIRDHEVDPHLIQDAHRWLFFDVTDSTKRYVLDPVTCKYVGLALTPV
jgi:hypothetical protein